MKMGLRGRILLIASMLVMLATGMIAVVSSYHFTKRATEAYASRSHAIAQGLAIQLERILALGIAVTELQGFEEQCIEAVLGNQGLSYAMVASPDGTILFHSDVTRMRGIVPSGALRSALSRGAGALDDAHDASHASLARVQATGAAHVATVVVGFPLGMIERERRSLLELTVAVGIVATLLVLGLLFIALSQQVIRPLSALVTAIEAIRSGRQDYSLRMPAARADELGVMVRGFNGLLDRIAEREAELVSARDAAQAASKAKSEFLAVMSHELRTPMNAVLGMAELLLRTDLNERQRLFATRVQSGGKSLMSLLNDILDFSRIEAGRLDLIAEPFDLRGLVRDTVALFSEVAAGRSNALAVTVDPTLPQRCVGDPVRIGQILGNLVSNAVKFTERGVVQVTVMPMGERMRFSVSDTGIGIEPTFMAHLYEAFRQADGTSTRRYGGVGLGLAIVKNLTDLLGGEVGVQSTVGRGSTFWVDLPLAQAREPVVAVDATVRASADARLPLAVFADEDSAPAQDASGAAGVGGTRRILLVEDDPANQDVVRLFLHDTPWELVVAGNGALAVEFAQRERFDAILMDWAVPGLDGVQAARAIREFEQRRLHARTPIIALTARVLAGDREACLAAGMDDYLAKPFERSSLIAMLQQWAPAHRREAQGTCVAQADQAV